MKGTGEAKGAKMDTKTMAIVHFMSSTECNPLTFVRLLPTFAPTQFLRQALML